MMITKGLLVFSHSSVWRLSIGLAACYCQGLVLFLEIIAGLGF
jgi:hypothetical protein